jgi:hypothetical protein
MDRQNKRKTQRALEAIARKAKVDMAEWLDAAGDVTASELNAWKAGYIAGINRVNNKDK